MMAQLQVNATTSKNIVKNLTLELDMDASVNQKRNQEHLDILGKNKKINE